MHTFISLSPMPSPKLRAARDEFPASKLILAGKVVDRGQLSRTQRADLAQMVRDGRLLKVGRTYLANVAARQGVAA